MELIKLFTGILFLICLVLNINFKQVQNYLDERKIIKESVDVSSPLGLYVKDFKGRVKIVDVLNYTPAMSAGLEPGDRILKVNGIKIQNVKTFFEAIEEIDIKEPVEMLVYRVDSCSVFPVQIKPFECSCK